MGRKNGTILAYFRSEENLMGQMLIIGCGYVGQRIAKCLAAQGESVRGIVRTPESAATLAEAGIANAVIDLDRQPLPPLPLDGARVFYLAPPPGTGATDPRMENFLAACADQGQPARILYFSTTGVYGDCAGQWVDETRVPCPTADRARRRWDAEQQLRGWSESTGGDIVIFRVAGIYGPGRLPLERLRRGLPLVREEEAPYTNRIHVDDLVQAAVTAMERAENGSLFNVSDGQPSTMNDYFNRVADLSGLPRPPVVSMSEAEVALSAGMLSYMQESRRLSNHRLRTELGWSPRYPGLAEGLATCKQVTK